MQNHLGQPIGEPLDWQGAKKPQHTMLAGRYCGLEPFSPRHSKALFEAFSADTDGRCWTYLPNGPYAAFDDFAAYIASISQSDDPLFFAICDGTGTPLGYASLLRISPEAGSIEVGWINLSPALQGTRASTEAQFLLMRYVFQLGYRRYEWKCDALNAPSRRTAARLGFTFEGVFRQATVYKSRNRDTAWFSVIDSEWPALCAGFEAWLSPDNFSDDGRQKAKLHSGE